ncbi:TIGR02678 family protein [Micromonospora matsumotoense]|uniref:TIGR02678 family protein n=1 Tax=Micromonospora matsumotoense TaxID=121616 RepID=UPI0034334B98
MDERGRQVDLLGDLPHIEAAQVRRCARALLRQPLLHADGPEADLLPLVYRHRAALRRLFAAYLGYPLRVERRFARLFKQRDDCGGRGVSGFTPRSYVYLALTLAALVEVGRQILLSQLVANVRGSAAEANITVSDDPIELRALAAALRHLVTLGVLEETEGTVTAVASGGPAEALITVDTELLGLLRRPVRASDVDSTDRAGHRPAAVDRAIGVLARRRLAEDPVVLYADLPIEEADYLRTHQRQESYWLDRYFGLQLEARAEGMVATDPDEYLTDFSFPGGSTVARMALLALEPLLAMSKPREVDRCHAVSVSQVRPVCAELVKRHPSGWAKSELANLDALASKVTSLLLQAGIARRVSEDVVVLVPAAHRWLPQVEERNNAAEPVSSDNVDELTLFGEGEARW